MQGMSGIIRLFGSGQDMNMGKASIVIMHFQGGGISIGADRHVISAYGRSRVKSMINFSTATTMVRTCGIPVLMFLSCSTNM